MRQRNSRRNTLPDGVVFRESWGNFHDAFGEAGCGWGFTHYAMGTGVRIDHVLGGPGCAFEDCRIGPEVGSPHLPVIADVLLEP